MSDHFDTADSRTDITDLYVFPAPRRGDRSVLVLDINPDASALEDSFDPAASYEIKIDTDGDLEADVAFHFLFASSAGGATANVYRATEAAARATGSVGEPIIVGARVSMDGPGEFAASGDYQFFAGLRSDPHFKDPKGLHNGFIFTGEDPIAKRNVFGIVLEVPNTAIGDAPIRLWARAMAPVHGTMKPVDQAGRPGINNTFNEAEADVLAFNETPPAEQRTRFGDKFIAFLKSLGYPDSEAIELAMGFLPDVLEYDLSRPPAYPNGRRLTDDTADLIVALLTKGRLTSDGAGPHTDLLDEFPYLGAPHPAS
ncbi:MAG TPA: DUF4331 family protein [Candidatus Limnocylindrales bacterium]|nr:DUF4331 family protein [Candidatus Limnocylindrales bacterium]